MIRDLLEYLTISLNTELFLLQEHGAMLRLVVATICGTLIGLEREFASKAAGLRTNILICTGSALFTLAGILGWQVIADASPTTDALRVAAQIVTGVGFLGAGVIYKSDEHITGITTAATIWFAAAVGMMVGIGFPLFGLLISISSAALLFALGRVKRLPPFTPKE